MFGNARENPKGYKMVLFNDIVEYMGDIGSNGANKDACFTNGFTKIAGKNIRKYEKI